MANSLAILDASGRPLAPAAPGGSGRARGLNGTGGGGGPGAYPYNTAFPYDAAQWQSQEMGEWLPWLRSPDTEINQFRDRMVARNRDLIRNDGWASGIVMRILDSTVGATLRLHANPDYRALQTYSKAFDAVWADEFRKVIEARWRNYWYDVEHYNDVSRELTGGQQFRIALNHKLTDGDSLMLAYWLPDRVGRGGAQYATAYQVVDPDRLSNPYEMVDNRYLRGGVEIDDLGAPVAYHIRKAHQSDWYNSVESMTWERIERNDPDGWRRVIHDCERTRAGQHRGVGIFAPVLMQMKMLARYYGLELQAAAIAASLGTYLTSPYDPAAIQDALGAGDDQLSMYQQLRADWSQERPAMFGGVKVPTLAPGEKIEQVSAAHPHNEFGGFTKEIKRTFAAATGLTYEQVSQDWSESNYSNLRGALTESWKTMVRRRDEFAVGTASPCFATWLQEEMSRGDLPLPKGAPDFLEARTAYARCGWLGPGRGYIDNVKEKQGAILGMDGALTTLKRECADSSGEDWEDNLDQRQIEVRAFEERNLKLPEWGGAEVASRTDAPPEAQ